MHRYFRILFVLTILFAAGCSQVKVTTEYDQKADFSSYKSFSICTNDLTPENPDHPVYDNAEMRLQIKDALESELKKHYILDDTAPQLSAGFHINLKDQQVQYWSCDQNDQYRTWTECRFKTTVYTEGTLTVYLADAASNQIIWHSAANGAVENDMLTSKKLIRRAIGELFKGFPPKHE